jgi:hypothetical protein
MRCPKGILVSILSPLSLFVLMKFTGSGSRRWPQFSGTRNVKVLNGALLMTQNVAERVSRLRSRNGRFPCL